MALMTCRGQDDCWCSICHAARFQQYSQMDARSLLRDFNRCTKKENELLSKLFEEILRSVAIAKAFRLNAERDTGYKQMKRALVRLGVLEEEATTLARTINTASWVYDNFQRITHNLTLECKHIDIRRLSLHQLYLAKDLSWCLTYQEQMKGKRDKPNHLVYDEEAFDNLVNIVGNHEVIESVSDDPRQLAALLTRLQKILDRKLRK